MDRDTIIDFFDAGCDKWMVGEVKSRRKNTTTGQSVQSLQTAKLKNEKKVARSSMITKKKLWPQAEALAQFFELFKKL